MSKSKRLIFFGTEDFSVPSLEKLISGGWNVVAVVTKPNRRSGRGLKIRSPKVKNLAKKAGIKIFQPEKLADISDDIKKLKPEFGILVAYGQIIPDYVLDIFPGGIINVHPSLLPKYRGPSPIETAILNGDKQSGVSLMRLTAKMDEGPVYSQKRIDIPPDVEADSFSRYLAQQGAELLIDNLEPIFQGWLTPKPQMDADASYSKLLKKEDGIMDFGKPAVQLEREIRAYAGWPKSRAKIDGHEVIVTKAHIVKEEDDGNLVLKCHPGYLDIIELIAPSGRKISGSEFLRGYRQNT